MPGGYSLIDAGDGRRLERFAERVLDRPAPTASDARRDDAAWAHVDARFDRPAFGREFGRWETFGSSDPWTIDLDGIRLELRYGSGGQVGVFPEHLGLAAWVRARITDARAITRHGDSPAVLNLFAYTGALTVAGASARAAIAHVDASRPAVGWARRNADLSGVGDCPIRWLVEDAPRFVRRELARERRYAGAILDPPTYGHGPKGQSWRIERDLAPLLRDVAGLLEGPSPFLLVTAHTAELGPDRLAALLRGALAVDSRIEAGELALTAESGARLSLGAFARWPA